jgi:hypothetical protein
MSSPAAPGQVPSVRPAVRRYRHYLLRGLRHTLLAGCLLGACAALAGLLLCYSPALAQSATTSLQRRLTAAPLAAYAHLEQTARAGDPPAVLQAGRAFLQTLPRPHPADTFAEQYRHALGLMLQAAAASRDTPSLLEIGELAVAFDPHDSLLRFNYGRALALAGLRDRAVPQLETAFHIRPTAPQILHALAPLVSPARAAELHRRHHEALALCMALPTWMSGNLVIVAQGQSQAYDLHLNLDAETVVGGPVSFPATSAYLVLPRVPELEVQVTAARLIEAGGHTVEFTWQPAGNLTPAADGFVRISLPDSAGLDDPAVITLSPAGETPPAGRFEVHLRCRPSAAVAAALPGLASPLGADAKPTKSH